jgi:hypothetical protein
MKPWKRICMNLLLLPNVTGLFMMVLLGFIMAIQRAGSTNKENFSTHITWTEILGSMALYYFLVLVPSILFTVAMEWFYRRGLKPRSTTAVVVSAACGCAAWLILAKLATLHLYLGLAVLRERDEAAGLLEWMVLGAANGLIVGLLVKLVEQHAQKKAGMA